MKPTFAFIGHPAYLEHLERCLKWVDPNQRKINPKLLAKVFDWTPAHVGFSMERVISRTGERRSGLFVVATLLPETLYAAPVRAVQKITEACVVAANAGVKISTLGGLTSVAGARAPRRLTSAVSNNVTTGNTLTVAVVVQQILQLANNASLSLKDLSLTVLGGTGDIGSACAELLVPHFGSVTVTGKSVARLRRFAERVAARYGRAITVMNNNAMAVAKADFVIAATSATEAILDPSDFKPGAIVSDVGYPKNIRQNAAHRRDILVYLGGLCRLEHPVDCGFDMDLPRKDLLYGCYAEAMVLDFERNYCNYSIGRGSICEQKLTALYEAAVKHGCHPAPPCQDGRYVEADEIRRILNNNPTFR